MTIYEKSHCPECANTEILKAGFTVKRKQGYRCRFTACDKSHFLLYPSPLKLCGCWQANYRVHLCSGPSRVSRRRASSSVLGIIILIEPFFQELKSKRLICPSMLLVSERLRDLNISRTRIFSRLKKKKSSSGQFPFFPLSFKNSCKIKVERV